MNDGVPINLASQTVREIFLNHLTHIELHGRNLITEYDREFVNDMRSKFNSREDAEDLGCTPWSPSRNQWNFLINVWEKCK